MLPEKKLRNAPGGVGILAARKGDEIHSGLQGQEPEELQCILDAMFYGVFDPLLHFFTQ